MVTRTILSLRARVLLLVLLAAGPLAALLIINAEAERQEQEAQAREQVLALARLAAEQQDDSIDEGRGLIDVLRHVPAIRNAEPEQCSALLREVAAEHQLVGMLQVASPDGRVLCHSVPDAPTQRIGDRGYFKDAIVSNETVVSDLVRDRATGKPTIIVARRIVDWTGGVRGVISASLDLSWFSRVSARLSGTARHVVLIVDRRGTVISHYPDPDTWLGKSFPDNPLTKAMTSQSEGVIETRGFDGGMRIFGFTELPGTPAHLAVGLDRTAAVGASERRFLLSLVLSVTIAAVAFAAAILGVEFVLVKPIRSIVQAAVRFGAGDLHSRSDARGPTELRLLQDAFNSMASSLETLITRDALTGLNNRRAFDKHLHAEISRCRREKGELSLLLMDVDRFKQYNDHYGHPAGDECLRRVASVLLDMVRRPGDMAARYGGEEFAVILPQTSAANALGFAERICEGVRALRVPHEHGVIGIVSISIGVATVTGGMIEEAGPFIERADGALYRAKQSGRNQALLARDTPDEAGHAAAEPAAAAPAS